MGGFVILGMLAAFGLVCALWGAAGLFLPRRGGTVVWLGEDPHVAVQRFLWLRELGLTRDKLLILERSGLDRDWIQAQGIEICSRENLIQRLKMGEKELDAGT